MIFSVLITLMMLGGDVPGVVCPAGKYVVTTPGPTVVTTTATSVTISWEATSQPAPAPAPQPAPVIMPSPLPAPAPVPVPRIVGPQSVILIYPNEPTLADLDMAVRLTRPETKTEVYAVSAESVTGKAWLLSDELKGSGLKPPMLVIATRNGAGTVVMSYAAPVPATDYDLAALIQATRRSK